VFFLRGPRSAPGLALSSSSRSKKKRKPTENVSSPPKTLPIGESWGMARPDQEGATFEERPWPKEGGEPSRSKQGEGEEEIEGKGTPNSKRAGRRQKRFLEGPWENGERRGNLSIGEKIRKRRKWAISKMGEARKGMGGGGGEKTSPREK